MVDEGVLSAEEIARVAGVARGIISDWRRRHADFPASVSGTGRGPVFNRAEVEAGLGERDRFGACVLGENTPRSPGERRHGMHNGADKPVTEL